MDIYRFFHPHHNPRLQRTPLRQLELSELELAAAELVKALNRAKQRSAGKPTPPILAEHFSDIIKAAKFIEESLKTLCDAHAGDEPEALKQMLVERAGMAGWENWVALVKEQAALHEAA